jgi:hypothetical protein
MTSRQTWIGSPTGRLDGSVIATMLKLLAVFSTAKLYCVLSCSRSVSITDFPEKILSMSFLKE